MKSESETEVGAPMRKFLCRDFVRNRSRPKDPSFAEISYGVQAVRGIDWYVRATAGCIGFSQKTLPKMWLMTSVA